MSLTTVTRLPVAHHEPPPYDPGPATPPPSDDDILSARRVFSALRRRKWLILGVMAALTGLAFLAISQITPLYESSAVIVVEGSREQVVDIREVVQGRTPGIATNETVAAILASRELAARVAERLNLIADERFNTTLVEQTPSLIESVLGGVQALFSGPDDTIAGAAAAAAPGAPAEERLAETLGGEDAATSTAALLPPDRVRELVIDNFLDDLDVTPAERAYTITIRYTDPDPNFAALAVNTLVEIYISGQIENQGEATSRAGDWLRQQADEASTRLDEAQRELADFRAEAGLVEVGDQTLISRQLADLNTELVIARNDRQAAQAQYDQVQELVSSGRGLDTAAAVMDNLLISRLREQETEVIRRLAEMRTQYGDNHPEMILVQAELADLRGSIAVEIRKIANRLGNDLEIADARVASLEAEVERLQTRLASQQESQVQLAQLQSQAQAAQTFQDRLLLRLDEVNVQDEQVRKADAQVISRAVAAEEPSYPNKKLMLMAALVGSAAIGVALSLIAEYMDAGFRSMSQVEQTTGVPAIGMIPSIKLGRKDGAAPHQVALKKPNSMYGEAIRSLRTALLLSSADRPPRTVAMTSSVPGEGKTSTALSLACMAAKAGQRTVILDCDLRKASLHDTLGVRNDKGLADYLAGLAPLSQVIDIELKSGVHYITAGTRTPNPPDLLQSEEMNRLLAELGAQYDLVVLDTPPLMAVSDALVLLRRCDKTVFLVRWEQTRRETVVAALRQVYDSGASLAGVMLNQVDVKKLAKYGSGDSGYYYYKSYKKYYAD